MRTGISITLKPADRRRLAALARDRNAAHKHVWRAEIVLLSADGVGTNEIMRQTGKSKTCVWRWQERFCRPVTTSLLRDKTRPSRIPPLGSDVAERVVALTRTDPPVEATHWTAAMMAKAVGISASSVQRIWRAHGLQPHRVQQFKLSNDPKFIDKLRDVVGLYVDPPSHAIILSVDEKSQIQDLDRTQPSVPSASRTTKEYAMNSAVPPANRAYADLHEHLDRLDAAGLLYRIDAPVNKDTEMHPLVRWQFRGGIAEKDRKAFLFTNIVDSKGRRYDIPVVVGAIATNPEIYRVGMNVPRIEDIGPAWERAIANPIAPRMVENAPCHEIVVTGPDLEGHGHGLESLADPDLDTGF